jgi:hypothetical protein
MTTSENLPRFDRPARTTEHEGMAASENLPRFDRPARTTERRGAVGIALTAEVPRQAPVRPSLPATSPEISLSPSPSLNEQRHALLGGRECQKAGAFPHSGTYAVEPFGHVARQWHICPACFPGA